MYCVQEFLVGILVGFKQVVERGGGGGVGCVVNVVCFYVIMYCVNGYCYVVGVEQCLQCDQDLLCQMFLDLWMLGEELYDVVDF